MELHVKIASHAAEVNLLKCTADERVIQSHPLIGTAEASERIWSLIHFGE